MPREFNGRVRQLYRLRARYEEATESLDRVSSRTVRADAAASAAAMLLARAQREFNLQLSAWSHERRGACVQVRAPTRRPRTTEDYLSLLLAESRECDRLLAELTGVLREAVSIPFRAAA